MYYTSKIEPNTPIIIDMHETSPHLLTTLKKVKKNRMMGSLLNANGNIPIWYTEFEENFDNKWNDEVLTMFSGEIFPQDDK